MLKWLCMFEPESLADNHKSLSIIKLYFLVYFLIRTPYGYNKRQLTEFK